MNFFVYIGAVHCTYIMVSLLDQSFLAYLNQSLLAYEIMVGLLNPSKLACLINYG